MVVSHLPTILEQKNFNWCELDYGFVVRFQSHTDFLDVDPISKAGLVDVINLQSVKEDADRVSLVLGVVIVSVREMETERVSKVLLQSVVHFVDGNVDVIFFV